MSPQDKILKCSKCKIRANQLNVEGKSAFYIVCPTCGVKRDAVWFESFNRKYAEYLATKELENMLSRVFTKKSTSRIKIGHSTNKVNKPIDVFYYEDR